MDYSNPKIKQAVEVLQSFMAVTRTASDFTRRNAESLGLTMQSMSVVNTLHLAPGLTLKELTERLHASKSTLSVSVEGLVQAGIAERTQAEGNRREINVKLTPKGEELAKRSIRQAYSYRAMAAALEKLDGEHIRLILDGHRRILDAMAAYDIDAELA